MLWSICVPLQNTYADNFVVRNGSFYLNFVWSRFFASEYSAIKNSIDPHT